jgi:pteridine reductase
VAIHFRSSEAEARELAGHCPGSIIVRADLADPAERARLLPQVADRFGSLDFLVNNASVYDHAPLAGIDEAAFERAVAVNLAAPFFLARDAGLMMRAAGFGAIVNVTDSLIDRPYPDRIPYFAAKAGLEAVTRGLARALAPEVRVNAVAPGPILLADGAGAEAAAAVERAVPLGRLGGPEAVATAVLFLLNHDFLTGETIRVDGGRALK